MASNTVLPVFTGPYTSIKPEIKRLRDFVKYTAKHSDVRNRYPPDKLQEHISYIEDKIQTICAKVGEYNSQLSSSKIVRQGSSYKGTKILKPDELDYMPILAMFNKETVVVEDVKENCYDKDTGCVYIKVINAAVRDNLGDFCKHTPSDSYLKGAYYIFLTKLQEAVKWALCQINSLTSKDEHKHKDEDHSDPYPLGHISVCVLAHGPSITLKIGAPLCTAKVDLCFSIEGRVTNLGQCVMVCGRFSDNSCNCGLPYSTHWKESPINPPNKYELSESHRELFLTLKLINHILTNTCHHLGIDTAFAIVHTSSSYHIQSLVWQHQQTCQATNVGECYRNIVQMLNPDQPDTPDELYVKVLSQQGHFQDMFFPKVVREIGPLSLIGFIWFLHQVSHTKCTEWWETLFTEENTKYHNNEHLSTLCEALNKVNEILSKVPHTVTWRDDRNNPKASLTISRW
ncbi:unnamed protein product [Owenia fusiformis]|uniref:Uncharacterized protein n=1 Tax=Owenia fusiformis TaxID=6347 RepID=A0A8S4PUQ5_OWEFU|nr:unnamed protein product [Owenia fusiformis]